MNSTNDEQPQTPADPKPRWRIWLERVGVAGFLFFLAKGLLWVAIFMGLGKLVGC
jgi:hypothetical protein